MSFKHLIFNRLGAFFYFSISLLEFSVLHIFANVLLISVNYELFPNEPGEGNSNSMVGSILKKAGSDFTPSRGAPGIDNDISVKPKPKKGLFLRLKDWGSKRRKD